MNWHGAAVIFLLITLLPMVSVCAAVVQATGWPIEAFDRIAPDSYEG